MSYFKAAQLTNHTTKLLLVSILLSLISQSYTYAQSKEYGDGFNEYLRSKQVHKAFAISRGGLWYWFEGKKTRQDAIDSAVARCNKSLKNMRPRQPEECFVVHADDDFTLPDGHKIMSVYMAIPVMLEIYDGYSSNLQKFSGLILSKFKHGTKISKKRNRETLITESKMKICEGISEKESQHIYYYEIRCFGKHKFSGRTKILGRQVTGYFRTPIFDIKMTKGNSYLRMISIRR